MYIVVKFQFNLSHFPFFNFSYPIFVLIIQILLIYLTLAIILVIKLKDYLLI